MKTWMLLRPSFFARCNAISARLMTVVAVLARAGKVATPMLAERLITRSPSSIGRPRVRTTSCASVPIRARASFSPALSPSSTSMKPSPPMFATSASPRPASVNRAATSRSSSSPTSWLNASLTTLKWSRSQ